MTGTDSSGWLGLSGRICVVTGGGGGIGRATALSFAKAGARVAAIDLDERGLDATISVKLTQLGLDFSTDLAVENLQRVLAAARDRVVMIDMESSAYVDRTLEVHRALRRATDRVGVCLQAYLQRTREACEALVA